MRRGSVSWAVEAPLALPTFQLNAVAPTAAMMDAGLAWLVGLLAGSLPTTARSEGVPAGSPGRCNIATASLSTLFVRRRFAPVHVATAPRTG